MTTTYDKDNEEELIEELYSELQSLKRDLRETQEQLTNHHSIIRHRVSVLEEDHFARKISMVLILGISIGLVFLFGYRYFDHLEFLRCVQEKGNWDGDNSACELPKVAEKILSSCVQAGGHWDAILKTCSGPKD